VIDKYKDDLLKNAKCRGQLLQPCEKAKIELSGCLATQIELDQINEVYGEVEPITVTVDDFSQAAEELFIRCQLPVNRLLESHNIAPTECRFLMVGGSSPIQFLKTSFGPYLKKGAEVLNDLRGTVARGAALCAAELSGLQPETSDGQQLKITEISAHSIGIEVLGGGFSVVIAKGTELPCQCTRRFQTADGNQTRVSMDVYEGEDPVAKQIIQLSDNFVIGDLPPRRAGEIKVDVEMTIDSNGILHLRVIETANKGNVVSGVVDTAAQRDFQLAPKIMDVLCRSHSLD
jgi:molecular chaperone DnaK